jgi:23S rRNA U2552 (ribose-2'-O)-methylase RlmE/FtsJ
MKYLVKTKTENKMEKPKIIFTKRGNISQGDKNLLKENGVIVIDVDDLSAIKSVNEVDNDIVMECAMETIHNSLGGTEKSKFFDKFFIKFFENKNKDKKGDGKSS